MGERDEPWSHVLAIFSLLARPPQIVVPIRWGTGYAAAPPGATSTGPVRRRASARKQDKRSGAVGERNSHVRESSSQ